MFHPLSVLDTCSDAIALEMDRDTLDTVLDFDGALWTGNAEGYNGAAPLAPMPSAVSVLLDTRM